SEPKRLSQRLSDVPPELEGVVSRMLAKDRDARYQSAQDALTDLKRAKARCELLDDGAGSEFLVSESRVPNPQSSTATPGQPFPGQSSGYETNLDLRSEMSAPSQAGFDTNVIPSQNWASGQSSWQGWQGQYSGAPTAVIPQRPQKSRPRRLLLPGLVGLG